ncbi:MAG: aromatic ring-hydroxylating dioxygenase subunit alpha [Actinomycetota bacterium]|nr:aromatic ring-hydroxylating dioxygenase subunit alpha [Actinomycetota bacterium]
MTSSQLIETLTGHEYSSDEVYERERERIFHRSWFYVCRDDRLSPGDRFVADVAGESVLVVKDRDGHVHAHANVCRHRGARLCEQNGPGSKAGITCPYHAWTYSLDGRLIGTPHLTAHEIDRESLSLWSVACEVWQGFVFVNLSPEPMPLFDWFAAGLDSAQRFEHLHLGELGTAVTTSTNVQANWKILVENYQECLHCSWVHPELVDIVPLYKTGSVVDPARPDGGVTIRGNSFSLTGRSSLPLLPHMPADEAESYYGATVFPNMFVDVTGTCVIVSSMWPKGPGETTVVMEYLFAPGTIAAQGFDPHEIVEFSELVGKQDYDVSERVQRGVTSRYFVHGVLAPQDQLIVDFLATYRSHMTD